MIKEILDEIANEGSTNQKMVILKKYKDNTTLQQVMYLARSKRVKFYIKQIPFYTNGTVTTTLEDAMNALGALSSRTLTGNDASEYLGRILSNLSKDDAYVIERIIDKDLKIGMGSNINKVIPNLIEKTPYMGAKPFSVKLAKEIFELTKADVKAGLRHRWGYADVKMDGRYNNAIIRGGEVELESRQGETVILSGKFVEELSKFPDCVLNGELTIDGEPNRSVANGIVSSLIDITKKENERGLNEHRKKVMAFEKQHGCTLQAMMDRVVYTIWDTITIDEYFTKASNTPYYIRWNTVQNMINTVGSTMVREVEKVRVNTYEEAITFFQLCLNRGLEGAILKTFDGVWKDSKPTWQVKMKLEMDIDLKVVGFKYGTPGSKNENVISTLICESEDGKLSTNPAGMSEALMQYVTDHQTELKGAIVHVQCNGISQDSTGAYSLMHPRVGAQEFRDDKTKADTLPEIQAIENMAKGLS